MYRSREARTRGTTLVEVLVSMVVLATGLTGMMSLQVVSLRVTHDALLMTRATMLAQDMAERLYANPAGYTSGAYSMVDAGEHSDCFTVAGCSPAAMAATDVAQWQALVSRLLPDGHAVICIDSAAHGDGSVWPSCDGMGQQFVIALRWTDGRDGTAAQYLTLALHL